MSCNDSNKSDIPPEIVHTILTDVLVDYVDRAITQERQTQDTPAPPWHWEAIEARDPLPEINALSQLSSVSFTFRDITLKILSEMFGIQRNQKGSLVENPSKILLSVRRLWRLILAGRLVSPRNDSTWRSMLFPFENFPLSMPTAVTNPAEPFVRFPSPLLKAYISISFTRFAFNSLRINIRYPDINMELFQRSLANARVVFGSLPRSKMIYSKVSVQMKDILLSASFVFRLQKLAIQLYRAHRLSRMVISSDLSPSNYVAEAAGVLSALEEIQSDKYRGPRPATVTLEHFSRSGVIGVLQDVVDDPLLPKDKFVADAEALLKKWTNFPA